MVLVVGEEEDDDGETIIVLEMLILEPADWMFFTFCCEASNSFFCFSLLKGRPPVAMLKSPISEPPGRGEDEAEEGLALPIGLNLIDGPEMKTTD